MRRPLRPVGFTLLELMIALAVAAVLGAIATPSFTGLVQHQRLQAAAHHLQADIALARRESTLRGQAVTLQFQPGSLWCYSLGTGAAIDCQRPAVQEGSQLIKRVQWTDYPGITLLQADAMALDPQTGTRLGILARGRASFAAQDGQQLQVRLGPQGRASICAPAAPVTGTPPCPADPPGQ